MNKAIIIYGPTATGKTALAIKLAKIYNGEIISADSRQVYKGLDIGTGKVSFESHVEKFKGYWIVDGIKIYGFDLVSPGDQFTVWDFLKFSSDTMIRIIRTKRLPVIVGGTGFYIKTLNDGIETIGIPANSGLRKELEKLSREELYKYLIKINRAKAKSMNKSDSLNPRRLIRAIEIAMYLQSTSEVKSSRYPDNTSEVKEALVFGLTAPNIYLYERADKSFDSRLKHGMTDEIKSLLSNGVNSNWLDNLGLEYRWLTRSILGQISKEDALKKCKGELHSFIRHQKTWFKQFKNDLPAGRQVKIYDITRPLWENKLLHDVELWYNSHSL